MIGFKSNFIDKAIEELKENEFKTLFENENRSTQKNYVKEVQVDTDFEILFPDEYINIVNERLLLYNELSAIKDEPQLMKFKKNIEDRFGEIPPPGQELLGTLRH